MLVESQALVTGAFKGSDYLNWPLTLTMCMTLSFAFMDFVSDVAFTFGGNLHVAIRVLAVLLLGLQVVVQLLALYGSVQKVRKQLGRSRGLTQLAHIRQVLLRPFCGCILLLLFYPFIMIFYYTFVCIISIILGLTKLITIKQVTFFFSFCLQIIVC